uniref:Putative GPIanchored serine rich tenascinlike glycoprotein n=1 Tax=Albugo laibachii Nc14 TaxID=890382 RepID=F0W2M5_9STRA|nr:putative GPIanchored serine rich tenascinlike glycoprotein [Albugo laibachii Nc14]|eukprot:CCA15311.1 putative GPIanchored serine rich tenascinlike glycoprotein [Albugo laibachii Nc14]
MRAGITRWIPILSIIWVSVVQAQVKKANNTCEDDSDCSSKYPGTACISVGTSIKKCTSNTPSRPACRGKRFGACPVYQSPEAGYLNAHCIFVASENSPETTEEETTGTDSTAEKGTAEEESPPTKTKSKAATADEDEATPPNKSKTKASSEDEDTGTTTASSNEKSTTPVANRLLQQAVTAPLTPTLDSTASTSSTSEVLTGDAVTGDDAADETITIKIGKKTITGSFQCVDSSECESAAYDTSTCQPEACGQSDGSTTVCNNQGTCTYKSLQKMSKRTCMCYPGFGGSKCEKTVSAACDVDCGFGGTCVSGKCKCKAGFDGKEHKGKKGKKDLRCTKCTSDLGCQNNQPCDIETGKCACGPGFNGPTCGATEDSCTKRDCGHGACQVLLNGTAACFCTTCSPNCEVCKTKDCSDCESAGVTLQFSKGLIFTAVLLGVFILNL